MSRSTKTRLVRDHVPPPSEVEVVLEKYAHFAGSHIREYVSPIQLSVREGTTFIRTPPGQWVAEHLHDMVASDLRPTRPLWAMVFASSNHLRILLNAHNDVPEEEVWAEVEQKLLAAFTMFAGNAGARFAW